MVGLASAVYPKYNHQTPSWRHFFYTLAGASKAFVYGQLVITQLVYFSWLWVIDSVAGLPTVRLRMYRSFALARDTYIHVTLVDNGISFVVLGHLTTFCRVPTVPRVVVTVPQQMLFVLDICVSFPSERMKVPWLDLDAFRSVPW